MKVDSEKIKHLERLARIELSEDEVGPVTEQLDRIVEFVARLQTADTSGVDVTGLVAHGGEKTLREDAAGESMKREALERMAPDFKDGFFRVPSVIDKENV